MFRLLESRIRGWERKHGQRGHYHARQVWNTLKHPEATFDHVWPLLSWCFIQGHQWDIEDLGPRLGFDIPFGRGVTGPPVGGGIKFISLDPQHDVIQSGGRRLSWLVHVGLLWFTWWMSSSMLTSMAPSGSHLLQGNAAPVPMQLKAMKALAAEEKWLIDSWRSIFQRDSRFHDLKFAALLKPTTWMYVHLRYLRFVWKTFLQILTDLISLWKVRTIIAHPQSFTFQNFKKILQGFVLSLLGLQKVTTYHLRVSPSSGVAYHSTQSIREPEIRKHIRIGLTLPSSQTCLDAWLQ